MADEEKQLGTNVVAIGSDSGSQKPRDKALEKKLIWKTDLILMPALGMSFHSSF